MDKTSIKAFFSKTIRDNNVVYVLIAFMVVSAFISPVFMRWANLSNIMRTQSALAIMTMGMLLVILTGGIDLSVGAVIALSCVTFASCIVKIWPEATGGEMVLAMLIAVAVCTLAGTITGILVAYFNVAAFVASLAMMTICRGIAYIISNGEPVRYDPDTPTGEFLDVIGTGKIPGIDLPWPVLIALIVIIIVALVLRYTSFGRIVIAIGSNEDAVRLAGIDVRRNKMLVYTITGFLCGLAGLVIVARSGVGVPSTGEGMELDALAACVVGGASLAGGKGNAFNTTMGVLVFGLISNIMNLLSFPAYPQQVVKGLIIIAAVLAQQFAGRERRTKEKPATKEQPAEPKPASAAKGE